MDYYVVQLLIGKEKLFLKFAENSFEDRNMEFFWLRKELYIKKGGIKQKVVSSIFPGYIFIEADEIAYINTKIICRFPGFCRFLKSNNNIKPLNLEEKSLISRLKSVGNVAGISRVFFNDNDKIQVVSGPMKGLEGKIIKVDKRKKRAKIELTLYENSFPIDFGFDLIEQMPKSEDTENEK